MYTSLNLPDELAQRLDILVAEERKAFFASPARQVARQRPKTHREPTQQELAKTREIAKTKGTAAASAWLKETIALPQEPTRAGRKPASEGGAPSRASVIAALLDEALTARAVQAEIKKGAKPSTATATKET